MNFDTVKKNYDQHLWNKIMVAVCVRKGIITAAQYSEIVGEPYGS